nr:zinc finger, CCHC-type, retrotransposon Gag domain protein [Tanacetum cinerariifolium]GFB70266.1 zinc finger, CCHC-type, retrotransposon Gag domain protein [Tanacetum cinerariifolium]
LAGFVGKKAGPPEEQAKHFKWALCDWILDGILNTEFTDVAQGKVFSLTRDQATNSSGTISGTLLMNDRVVFVLFDTGATYSVISITL